MRRKRTGFTIVELLAALGIIALMVGLLIPALSMVRRTAKETKQKAQFTTISLALTTFKNDYGDYPPSDWTLAQFTGDYCGAQKLAEALLGWDLLGFHPNSAWRADGLDAGNGPGTYDPAKARDNDGDGVPDSFDERKGPYLELPTTNAFRLGNIFNNTAPLAPNTFVLCDVFGAKKVTLANGKTVKAGAPILYYRANTSGRTIREIYNTWDNDAIVAIKDMADDGDIGDHPLGDPRNQNEFFYGNPTVIGYIQDPKVMARPWPYRPGSYILISAGVDGLYGTGDDIRNFGN